MHENKFEKQVREKMNQLGFDPSDAVWTRVDQEINQEKKKRRPLFWIFFFTGLMLGAVGVYTVMQINYQGITKTMSSERPTVQDHKKTQSVDPGDENPERKVSHSYKSETSMSSVSVQNRRASWSEKKQVSHQMPAYRSIITGKEFDNTSENKIQAEESTKPKKNDDSEPLAGEPVANNKITEKGMPVVAVPKDQKTNKTPIADSISVSNNFDNRKQKTKVSPWSYSITATAGISNINQSLFQSVNTANNSYYAYTPPQFQSRRHHLLHRIHHLTYNQDFLSVLVFW